MTPSQTCIDLIKSFEQCRLTAYKPTPNDVWTIGWGTTGEMIGEGLTWTQTQADAVFALDVAVFAAHVTDLVTSPTTQNQFDALISLAYNIGLGAFQYSTLRRYHNAGQYIAAQNQFAVWCHQAGEVLPGLVRRRAAEAALYGKPDQ